MSTVSLTFRRAFNAQQTGEIPVFLLTVEHPSLGAPVRFSSDPTSRLSDEPLSYGTTSRGQNYVFLPISVVMPDDSADAPPALRLVLDNVDRGMIPLLRSISTPPQVTVEMVLASAPDLIEVSWPEFDLVNITYTDAQISADLAITSFATEPYPAGTFSPAHFPGLF